MKSQIKNEDAKARKFISPVYDSVELAENAALNKENRSWWERNPMRYDWNEALQYKEFSKEFYQEIDRRFFLASENMFLKEGLHKSSPQPPRALSSDEPNKPRHHRI